ncbi:hypothetical protein D3C77_769420 [compost metagenome]
MPIRAKHLETHAMQMDRVLILGHVLELENIAFTLLQRRNRSVGTGFIGDIPRFAVDLPKARRLAVFSVDRD